MPAVTAIVTALTAITTGVRHLSPPATATNIGFRRSNPTILSAKSLSIATPNPKTLARRSKSHRHDTDGIAAPAAAAAAVSEENERRVHCELDVVSWRERRVRAWISVNADVESVWNVLTDYERLADFVPNLVYSGRIPCPRKGRIWVEQRGLQQALYWQIEARVVLEIQEFPNSANGSELRFSMVDGDFKKFEGKWSVKAGPRSSMSTLSYEVSVIPRFNFPAIFLERIIRSDLPVNLHALAWRAERQFEENQKIIIIKDAFGTPLCISESSPLSLSVPTYEKDILSPSNSGKSVFGMVIASPSTEANTKWGVYGKTCRLDKQPMVDEIHLRRYDGLLENGGAHRCVVASITIKAPVREVWNVLTAYESLPEIVPNLAISKVLSRDNNKVRILQEGCKGLLYMVLHARVVLDLCEEFEQEISFEQVEGDFDEFKGKWLLEQLGDQHTLLKYTVESRIHKGALLSEAILEEVVYEDLPSNLSAIRDAVENRVSSENNKNLNYPDSEVVHNDEKRAAESSFCSSTNSTPLRQRPKVPGLQRDIEVLKAEIRAFVSDYGQDGFMPMRKQLRLHGRIDIEKAITRMGGFRKIASLMNLSLAYKCRKPKGYWDNLENLQEEISRFQRSWGMDTSCMPSRKSFERAGRYDIARALEKWGGLQEVSRLLSLEMRHQRRRADTDEGSDVKGSNDLIGQEKTLTKPYIAQDTQKWILKLKDLDINWVE